MPKKPVRRFLDLEVDEVSVVDSPANEIQFLVTKNLEEEDEMPRGSKAGAQSAELVAVEHPGNPADESVAKAMLHVSDIVENITSMVSKVGTKKAAADDDDDDDKDEADEQDSDDDKDSDSDSDDDKGDEDDDKGEDDKGEDDKKDDDKKVEKGSGRSIRSLLKTLGLRGDALKKAEGRLKAAGLSPDTRVGGAVPTKKSEAAGAPEPEMDEDDPMLTALAESISKAKRLTPARIKKLQEAAEIINKLVIESIAQGTSPKMDKLPLNPTFESQMKPKGALDRAVFKGADDPVLVLADVMKSGFEAILKSLQGVKETTEENSREIDSIKKARVPSNSLDEQGVTEQTKKANSSFWRGII